MSSYKRLSFEILQGNDSNRIDRIRKGLLREIVTAKLQIPYSEEGTLIHQNIDRNFIQSFVSNRNEVSKTIKTYYKDLSIEAFNLALIDTTTGGQHEILLKYNPTGEYVTAFLTA